MAVTSVRVPGKVMLTGEYAVLYGGVAVMMPVPRYMKLTETEQATAGQYPRVVQEALNLIIPDISEFEQEHGKPNIRIDRSLFYAKDEQGNETKLGLGSSAAEAVGVIKLRFKRANHVDAENPDLIMEYAFQAHDKAQGGIGSGADIAACVTGAPIKFISKYDEQMDLMLRYANGFAIGYRYPIHLAWTGIPADTRAMVSQFSNWFHHGGESAEALVAELVKITNEISDLWFGVPQDVLFKILDEYSLLMLECARESGISYRLPIHEQIEAWAEEHGGRAKPTGAGGGDMILLIGDLPLHELKQLIVPLDY